MSHERLSRLLVGVALVLAASGWPLAALLYLDAKADARQDTEEIRRFATLGCERQNRLRRELDQVLADFHIPPRFPQVDCDAAYRRDLN
jgi:hypothetical protein